MAKSAWENAVAESPEPQRSSHFGTQFNQVARAELAAQLAPEYARIVASVFSGSLALSEGLLAHPEWLELIEPSRLAFPRKLQSLEREVAAIMTRKDLEPAKRLVQLRLLKQREMLRIGARDLARLTTVSEVTLEISNVADVCINAVARLCFDRLKEKYGRPYSQDPGSLKWHPARFCVLGMGKLGGQELNYSSDIDVLFVYSGEGSTFKTPPTKSSVAKGTPNHQFFARLAEAIIAESTRMTAEGFLFRIDLRLRPEGKTSPLARTLSSYETYYAQWGQTWERMMLIKARGVAGDQSLAAEFLEMVHPFRYPRAISEQIPREVAEMKVRIENEVVRAGELERNVKLGRGGIREIEFLVQTLQVLHAGRNPFLQGAQTLPLLDELANYNLLDKEEAGQLQQAYGFLRDVEHRLQMEANQQTHTIPVSVTVRTRLARLMGFNTLGEFEAQLQQHNHNVRAAYEKVITPVTGRGDDRFPPIDVNPDEWRKILAEHSFRDPERCVKLAQEFVQGPGFGHRSTRTMDLAMQLLQYLLKMCPRRVSDARPHPFLSDPDRVLARLDAFVARYGARSMLYDAWVSNPSLFRLLLLAFDRSEFLAELAIREPDLIDEIEQSGQLRRKRARAQILEDLRHGSDDEDQQRWLRRYFQAEQMRIGLRDILDLATPELTQLEISEQADAFLTYALEVVLRQNRLKKPPFAIIGLGKLGGRELIYASDLDIIFVAEDKVANLPFLQKLGIQLLELLSKRTVDGVTFAADARLRPNGEKGLLVNTLGAYSEYYRKRAMLWEIQSLSRFRPITGEPGIQSKFAEMALTVTDLRSASGRVAAYTPEWKSEIHRMRLRIEKERTPPGKGALAIKTGSGGLMDVEFVAQALCLEHGWHQPNTLAAIAHAAEKKVLSEPGARLFADNYRKLIQIERILRRWSFESESLLPDDPAAFYRVAARCGFSDSNTFAGAVHQYRTEIRREYLACFGATDKPPRKPAQRKTRRK